MLMQKSQDTKQLNDRSLKQDKTRNTNTSYKYLDKQEVYPRPWQPGLTSVMNDRF